MEEVQKRLKTLKPHLFKDEAEQPSLRDGMINKVDLSSEESDDEEDNAEEIKNKAVDRTKKLTKQDRNLKLIKRLRHEAQEEARREKLWIKELNKLP